MFSTSIPTAPALSVTKYDLGNMTINTAAERTAQPIGSSLRVVKPKHSTVVGKVRRIPIEA